MKDINLMTRAEYLESQMPSSPEKRAAIKAAAKILRKAAKKAAKTERVERAKAKKGGRRTRRTRRR